MNGWIRFTAAAALALASVEGHAKVADKCIQMLGGQPTPQSQPPTSRPCPMVIGYDLRDLRQGGALANPSDRSPSAAGPRSNAMSRTAPVTEPSADADALDQAGPALHV